MLYPEFYKDSKGLGINQISKVESRRVNRYCEMDWERGNLKIY